MRFAAVRQIYILFNIYLLLVTNITNLLKDYFITNTYYQKFIFIFIHQMVMKKYYTNTAETVYFYIAKIKYIMYLYAN